MWYVYFYGIYTALRNRGDSLSNNFHGILTQIKYDVKGFPEVTVDGRDYYLLAGCNFDYLIKEGDSLTKQQGSNTYRLVKKTEFKN